MGKIHKISNIVLIFVIIGVFLCSEIAYTLPDSFKLRPPLQCNSIMKEYIELQKKERLTSNEAINIERLIEKKDMDSLVKIGEPAVPYLRLSLVKNRNVYEGYDLALGTLAKIAKNNPALAPKITHILAKEAYGHWWRRGENHIYSFREDILRSIGDIGPAAVGAAPYIIKLSKFAIRNTHPSFDLYRKIIKESILALGKIDPEGKFSIPYLFNIFLHDLYETKEAKRILLNIGEPVIPYLEKKLKDKDQNVSNGAAEILARLNWPPENQHEEITYLIAKQDWPGLVKIGKPAVPYLTDLIKTIRGKDLDYKKNVIKTLGEIGPDAKDAFPYLIKATIKASRVVSRKMRNKEYYSNYRDNWIKTLSALIKALNKEDLIDSLSDTEKQSLKECFIGVLDRKYMDQDTLVATVKGMGNLDPEMTKDTVPYIAKWLSLYSDKEEYNTYNDAADIALQKIGQPAISSLKNLLEHKDLHLRKIAEQTLARLNWPPENQHEEITYLIAKQDWPGLVKIGKPAVPYLTDLIKTIRGKDLDYKKNVIKTLGEIGPDAKDAFPYLIKATIKASRVVSRKMRNKEYYSNYRDNWIKTLSALIKALNKEDLIDSLSDTEKQSLKECFIGVLDRKNINQDIRVATLEGLGILGDNKVLPKLLKMLSENEGEIKTTILRAIFSILSFKNEPIANEILYEVLQDGFALYTLYKEYPQETQPQLYPKDAPWVNTLARFISHLERDVNSYPQEAREGFRNQAIRSISKYMKNIFNGRNKNINEMVSEYREITSLLEIVHDNLSLCLSALGNIDKRISDFSELRKILPLNNSLTRIVRYLGESRSQDISGYKDITDIVAKSGQFNMLYEVILDMAKRRKSQSPQEVLGLLEILGGYKKDLPAWQDKDWDLLKTRIEHYYNSGFKVISYNLFKYFIEHENNPASLASMRGDMEAQLSNIAWGGFNGLTDEFKKKYNITTEDELALLAKYIPIQNLGARDYANQYDNIKKVLNDITPGWKDEVDENLRKLFSLSGSKSIVVYQPEEKDQIDRVKLHGMLLGYIGAPISKDIKVALRGYIEEEGTNLDSIKKSIIAYCIEKGQHDIKDFKDMPQNDESLSKWLNNWHTILVDTYKHDFSIYIKNMVRDIILNMDSKKLEKLFLKHKDYLNKILERSNISISDIKKKKQILADTIIARDILGIFSEDISLIEKELKGFKTTEKKTNDSFYVGFFDDLLHLMGFMMTGVCTWNERDKQVANKKYHFGELALKDSSGKVLGLCQVQLVKIDIQGKARKESPNGWRVIAVPAINLYKGNIGMNKEKAVLALFECAQRLAEDMGMEGAVIPVGSGIHSNNQFEKYFIQELASKGYLKNIKLAEEVKLTPTRYSYKEVYLINIPKEEFFLKDSSLEGRIAQEKTERERLYKEEILSFKDGLGEIVYEKDISKEAANLLKKEVETIISGMPEPFIQSIRSKNGTAIRIKIDPEKETSIINKADTEIELTLSNDILSKDDKIDRVTLSEMLSELFTSLALDDYYELKEKSKTNENAYFKLEVIKALVNYRNNLLRYHKLMNLYGQDELGKYKVNLDQYTKGIKDILQWHLFLNVMDDARPDLMTINYIHVLFRNKIITEERVTNLINDIGKLDVIDKPSIASLRNLFKDFIFSGKVRLKILENIDTKEKFNYFDSTEKFIELKNILLTTENQNEFYGNLKSIIEMTLPLSKEDIDKEIGRLIDNGIFSCSNREETIKTTLEEILIRKIGKNAFTSFKEHLTGQRGFNYIPYIKLSSLDLPEGEDSDKYGFLEYVEKQTGLNQSDYDLVFKSGEEEEVVESQPYDWVRELFPIPEDVISLPEDNYPLGSPQAVFNLMRDGNARTRQEIAKILNRAERTLQPDLYFLVSSNILIKKGKGSEAIYNLNPVLLEKTTTLDKIQDLLNKRFKVLKEGWEDREDIKKDIKELFTISQTTNLRNILETKNQTENQL